MRSRLLRLGLVSAALLSALALPACGQDQGEECQVDSDCASGLVCVPVNKGPLEHGTCSPVNAPQDAAIDEPTSD